jgi:photosystem II stability/assembly factor-like uncharacterized protein
MVDEYGNVYRYQAAGSGWTQLAVGQSSGKVAMSADGATVVVTVSGGQIMYSHDTGTTWTTAAVPALNWYPVAISTDGTTIVAAASAEGIAGGIVMSKDAGATWTVEDETMHQWQFATITSDGTRPLVSAQGGFFAKGDGTVLAPQDASLDFLYEGDGAFFATREAGTAYGPY